MKKIEIIQSNLCLTNKFEKEEEKINEAQGDNAIAIHHIGSSSVPELAAMPIVDIILKCKDSKNSIKPLEHNMKLFLWLIGNNMAKIILITGAS
jgi:GrpB-like predicted nucleotidyltransferase (UPF0157 family)